MKRILKWLAHLYPSSWRNRYGAEYEALLEQNKPKASDAFDVILGATTMHLTSRSFVRIILPCALIGALAAVAMSFALPKRYVSETLISVATTDPRPIDHVLAEQVKDWFASPSLVSVIQQENLYPSERARMPLNDVVDLTKKNIWIRPSQTKDGKPAFVLEFSYPDPHVAQRVDEELVSGLIAANLRARVASANSDFLKEQLAMANDPAIKARIQSQLRQFDAAASQLRIAPQLDETFRVEHVANLPDAPSFPKRRLFGAGGLLAGLVCGLILAAIMGWRRRLTLANG